MSQALSELKDVHNDVVNNNQPEWTKISPRGGLIGREDGLDFASAIGGKNQTDKNFAGKDAFSSPAKQGESRFSYIKDGLESSVSVEGKDRVHRILSEVTRLSDVEKLLLYLKLPTGTAPDDSLRQTPTSFLHSSNRIEQAQAFTWIRSHLEEDAEICVPKHEVYDEYRVYCENHNLKPLCPADFGKVMKCVFPNVKPRRLGQRGQSKYCYSGLRKKLEVQPPSLPELEISPKKEKEETMEEDELFTASRQLVCEWAQKLLGRNFANLRELAEFLVGNLYVNSKSTAAFTVLAAMQEAGIQNSRVPVSTLFTSSSGGNKHKETQLQLQRKLAERELLKEQKKKLQQQRYEIERENDQLRSQTQTPSPALQSPVKYAARNITKLLQSPVSSSASTISEFVGKHLHNMSCRVSVQNGDCTTSVLNSDKTVQQNHLARPASAAENLTQGHVLDSSRDKSGSQFHVVRKPSVISGTGIQWPQPGMKSPADTDSKTCRKSPVTEQMRTSVQSNSLHLSTTSPPNDCSDAKQAGESGSHFALPSTPSRSAFVPVSQQRKESPSNNTADPSSYLFQRTSVSTDESDGEGSQMMQLDFDTNQQQDSSSKIAASYSSAIQSMSHSNSLEGTPSTISSSPQTPKKSRSRFTPIRPKVTPTKTVSSILREQKGQPVEGPTYDNRPVSAILKEKRAREAKGILAQNHGGQLAQGISVTGQITTVSTDMIKLPLSGASGSKSNELFIIVGSPKPGGSAVNGQLVSPGQNSLGVIHSKLDVSGNKPFTSNISVPVSSAPLPVTVVLARPDDAGLSAKSRLDSSSELSDTGNITDNESVGMNESTSSKSEMVITRDTDTPSGRKRKSSDRDIESQTSKRLNSSEVKNDEDDVFLPQADTLEDQTSGISNQTSNALLILDYKGQTAKTVPGAQITRPSGGKLSLESLESDALLDTLPMSVDQDLISSHVSKASPQHIQTASIGVNAKSLRPCQKQLLQQKQQLDQRISNFLSKGSKGNKEQDVQHQIEKARAERLLEHILQHGHVNIGPDRLSVINRTTRQATCGQPVNLLSLLRRPIVENIQPNMSYTKKDKLQNNFGVLRNTEELILHHSEGTTSCSEDTSFTGGQKGQRIRDEIPIKLNSGEVLNAKRTNSEEDSELPSDVADFIAEALAARAQQSENRVHHQITDLRRNLTNSQLFSDIFSREQIRIDTQDASMLRGSELDMDSTQSVVRRTLQEPFTVPSTPPPRHKAVENGALGKSKFAPVQRSVSMPVFVPPNVQHVTTFPPNRTIDSSLPPSRNLENVSPQTITQKSSTPTNFSTVTRQPVRRQRQSSIDRLSNQTPMSDAGYHSFDASPVMNSTPIPVSGSTDSLLNLTNNTSTFSGRSESAQSFVNDQAISQSPIALASPHATSTRSTPSSTSIAPSPIENVTSPNAFMPIQGGSVPASPLNSPQLVTLIKPTVTLASSTTTVSVHSSSNSKFANSIVVKLSSQDQQESRSQNKIGVLQQLLGSKGLPSYEEAVHQLGRSTGEGLAGSLVTRPDSRIELAVGLGNATKRENEIGLASTQGSLSSSGSGSERRARPCSRSGLETGVENISSLPEKKDKQAAVTDSKPVVPRDFPFSYQLALLHEKCKSDHMDKPSSKIQNSGSGRQSMQGKCGVTVSAPKAQVAQFLPSEQKQSMNMSNMQLAGSETSKVNVRLSETVSVPKQPTVQMQGHVGNARSHVIVSGSHFVSATSSAQANTAGSVAHGRTKTSTSLAGHKPAVHRKTFSGNSVPLIPPSPSNKTTSRQSSSSSSSTFMLDLPDVNYMGNAPNIDLGNILQNKHGSSGHQLAGQPNNASSQSGMRRNLTDMLEPSHTINEDELQSTLDILKSLDSHYFSQAELDIENLHATLPSATDSMQSNQANVDSSVPDKPANENQGQRSLNRSWSFPANVSMG